MGFIALIVIFLSEIGSFSMFRVLSDKELEFVNGGGAGCPVSGGGTRAGRFGSDADASTENLYHGYYNQGEDGQ